MRDELLELRAVVRGRVQGVGFRATVKVCADRLGLKGFVRNMEDGSVELCAQGKRGELEAFLERVRGAFPQGFVEGMATTFGPVAEVCEGFEIRR